MFYKHVWEKVGHFWEKVGKSWEGFNLESNSNQTRIQKKSKSQSKIIITFATFLLKKLIAYRSDQLVVSNGGKISLTLCYFIKELFITCQ